jgi:hypothetical protein
MAKDLLTRIVGLLDFIGMQEKATANLLHEQIAAT